MNPITRAALAGTLAALALTGTGCTSWFDPSTDDVVQPGNLPPNAATIQTLLDGARRDFALAYVGSGDEAAAGIALVSGLVADEYDNSDTFPTRQEMDRRDIDVRNVDLRDLYSNLQRARVAADAAAARAREVTPDAANTIAELHLLSGLVTLSFAENFCSGVPLSHVEGTRLVYDRQRTTTELYTIAIAKFDSALAATPGTQLTAAASLGKARALLGLGQFAEAGTLAGTVSPTLNYVTFHSEATQIVQNAIWEFVNFTNRWSVSAGTGGGIDFAEADDPRVPVENTLGPGFDRSTQQYNQLLFPTPSSSTPILTATEARLIQAEAALRANDPGQARTVLNALRATAGLPPLADAGTATARQNQLFRERAFWLFSTDRRLGDLRRLIRQYNRSAETVFPTGAYYKGGNYGTDVNIPVPFEERNNPNVGANGPECLNRNP